MLHHLRSIDTGREFGPGLPFPSPPNGPVRYAIQTIARMVGNSASEPDGTGSPPLDAWTVATLTGGVEGLCEHVGALAEPILEQALQGEGDAGLSGVTHEAPASIQ